MQKSTTFPGLLYNVDELAKKKNLKTEEKN